MNAMENNKHEKWVLCMTGFAHKRIGDLPMTFQECSQGSSGGYKQLHSNNEHFVSANSA